METVQIRPEVSGNRVSCFRMLFGDCRGDGIDPGRRRELRAIRKIIEVEHPAVMSDDSAAGEAARMLSHRDFGDNCRVDEYRSYVEFYVIATK